MDYSCDCLAFRSFFQSCHPATVVSPSHQISLYLDWLTNAWVEVCAIAEGNCSQCGPKARPTLGGEWVSFPCDDPLEGSVLKVIQEGDYLGFCEVEIITSEIDVTLFSSEVDENSSSEEGTQSNNEAPSSNGDDGGFNPLDLITTE